MNILFICCICQIIFSAMRCCWMSNNNRNPVLLPNLCCTDATTTSTLWHAGLIHKYLKRMQVFSVVVFLFLLPAVAEPTNHWSGSNAWTHYLLTLIYFMNREESTMTNMWCVCVPSKGNGSISERCHLGRRLATAHLHNEDHQLCSSHPATVLCRAACPISSCSTPGGASVDNSPETFTYTLCINRLN